MTAARRRLSVAGLAVAVAGVLVALALDAPPPAPPSLSPSSTRPDGTKALLLLAAGLGAVVRVGAVAGVGAAGPAEPSPGNVALLLADHLNAGDRAGLSRWVDAGGTLVTTDPLSPLAGVGLDTSTKDAIVAPAPGQWPGCRYPGAGGVTGLDVGGPLLVAGPGQVGCFPAGAGWRLVARRHGRGTVVVVSGPAPWTNGDLGDGDDSVLAANLLAPAPGTTLTVLTASPVGGGNQGLLGLISPRLVEGFWGLVGAFLVLCAWRARRLGRPVPEPVPVELPGSSLVVAAGHLLQEGGHRAVAAAVLREDLRRRLDDQVGVPRDVPDEAAAAIAAARTGVASADLRAALAAPAPADDADLVDLAQRVERCRRGLSRAR